MKHTENEKPFDMRDFSGDGDVIISPTMGPQQEVVITILQDQDFMKSLYNQLLFMQALQKGIGYWGQSPIFLCTHTGTSQKDSRFTPYFWVPTRRLL